MTDPRNRDPIDLPAFDQGDADDKPIIGVIDWLLAALLAVILVAIGWLVS